MRLQQDDKAKGYGEREPEHSGHAPIGCNKLNRIFITHMHGDHLFGLSSVILGIGFERNHQELRNASLSIYGPVGLTEYLSTCFRTCSCKLYYPLNIYELCRKDQHCGSDDAVTVSSVVLSPSDLNYAFIHPHSLYPDENGYWECVNESFVASSPGPSRTPSLPSGTPTSRPTSPARCTRRPCFPC